MKLKNICALFAAGAVLLTTTAFASDAAIYDISSQVALFKPTVFKETLNLWTMLGSSKARASSDGSIECVTKSADNYGMSLGLGRELYNQTKLENAMYWDFDGAKTDIVDWKTSTLETGAWTGFYNTEIYWLNPRYISVDDVQYYNQTISVDERPGATLDAKTDYSDKKTPSAVGSKQAIKVQTGANDWNKTTMGIRKRFSSDELKPGVTYEVSFYTMDNSIERKIYAKTADPSLEAIEDDNERLVEWCGSDDEPVAEVGRVWNKCSFEITPKAEDYVDNYTVLWIGVTSDYILRTEALYFDNIVIKEKADIKKYDFNLAADIKCANDVTVEAITAENNILFSKVISGNGADYESIDVDFSMSSDDLFYTSENRGSDNAKDADNFKIVFKCSGTEKYSLFLNNVCLTKITDIDEYQLPSKFAGNQVGFDIKLLANNDFGGTLRLGLLNEEGLTDLSSKDTEFNDGLNIAEIAGLIPNDVDGNSAVVIYVVDESENIVSERVHNIGKFSKNGVNIYGKNLRDALDIFGEGDYLIEFDANTEARTAEIRLGNAETTAAIADGYGAGVISIDKTAISQISNNEQIVITGADEIKNITLKKTAD